MVAAPLLALGTLILGIGAINASQAIEIAGYSISTTATTSKGTGLGLIGAGIASLGMFGSGLGQGYAAGKAAEAVSRNPEAESKVRSMFLVGAAVAESSALYAFVISIMIILAAA
eukprot:Selendium_serpulae@DN7353_c0_g1_i1.p1